MDQSKEELKPADVLSGSVPNAVSLVDAIRAENPDARIVYFNTWGRRDGDALNCSYYSLVCSFAGHTQALAEGYAQYQAATGQEGGGADKHRAVTQRGGKNTP